MPTRKTVLANGQIYHVFNRALDGKPVFGEKRTLDHADLALWYYRFKHLPISLSRYLNLATEARISYHNLTVNSPTRVKVYSYCLMSNHFHLLVEQVKDNGISSYLADFQNSFTRYYNGRKMRHGAIFQNQFKAVRIETEPQLLHVSRYIHLNPWTGYLVKDKEKLINYHWSSLNEYMETSSKIYQIAETQMVLGLFPSQDKYLEFVLDNADYQRELDRIKHLTFDFEG